MLNYFLVKKLTLDVNFKFKKKNYKHSYNLFNNKTKAFFFFKKENLVSYLFFSTFNQKTNKHILISLYNNSYDTIINSKTKVSHFDKNYKYLEQVATLSHFCEDEKEKRFAFFRFFKRVKAVYFILVTLYFIPYYFFCKSFFFYNFIKLKINNESFFFFWKKIFIFLLNNFNENFVYRNILWLFQKPNNFFINFQNKKIKKINKNRKKLFFKNISLTNNV